MKLDTHEIAWAAGFFDGEGTTSIQFVENRSPRLRLSLSQKSTYCLLRFRKAIKGRGQIYSHGQREMHQFITTRFEDTQFVVALLWKYLSYEKREQAKAAIKIYKANYKKIKRNSTTSSPATVNAVKNVDIPLKEVT